MLGGGIQVPWPSLLIKLTESPTKCMSFQPYIMCWLCDFRKIIYPFMPQFINLGRDNRVSKYVFQNNSC